MASRLSARAPSQRRQLTLLTAIAAGGSAGQMAELMLVAATERGFADGGHLLDFVNNEALDLIGWEYKAKAFFLAA